MLAAALVAGTVAPPDGRCQSPPAAESAALASEFGFLEAEELEKIPLAVVSRGPAIVAGLAPAVVDVITAEEIRTSGARTLAELLAQRVGIDVSLDRVVPRGLNTAVTFGTPLFNNRTLLLVDGRPTNGLFFGEFLAGRELPLEFIERIEIIRGPGSALYGTNAMAGVINVVTKDVADEPAPGAVLEYGSFSTRRVDAFGGVGGPRRSANFFFRYYGSGGANQLNRNDDQRQYFGFARGAYGPFMLEAEAQNFHRETPGTEVAPTPEDDIERERYSASLRIDQPFWENFRLLGRVYTNIYQTRLFVEVAEPQRTTYDERRVAQELALSYQPRDWFSVTLGGEVREDNGRVGAERCIRPGSTSGTVEIDHNGCSLDQNVYAAFLEDQIRLLDDLTLTAGFRYDKVTISGGRINPRFNLLWRADPATSLKFGYGEAFRAPSFFELRGAQLFTPATYVLGSPNLKPEVVKTLEGEIDRSFSRLFNVRLSAFYTQGSDIITQRLRADLQLLSICPDPFQQPNAVQSILCPVLVGLGPLPLITNEYRFANADRADVKGVEAALGGTAARLPGIPGELSYGLNYTYQNTEGRFRNPRSGEIEKGDLPLAPPHKVNLLLDYRPLPELSLFWHTRWVDGQFADAGNTLRVPGYFNHDVNLVYRFSPQLDLGLGLYNFVNDRHEEAAGVLREPLALLAHVAVRFPGAPAVPALALGDAGHEPLALGEARAAVESARLAGAQRVGLISYREAVAHLLIAEELYRKGAAPARVAAAAEQAKQSADIARTSVETMGGAPSNMRPAPAASPRGSTTKSTPPPASAPRPKQTPRPSPAATASASPQEGPSPVAPTPSPTLPPKPASTLSLRRILLLQSNAAVPIYQVTAARLTARLSGAALYDCRGDRQICEDALNGHAADLVVAVGSLAAVVAREAAARVPVLFCAVLNPERYDLHEPNVGGVSFGISIRDQLDRLHAGLPWATRIGLIYDPSKSAALVHEAQEVAGRLGLRLIPAEARDPRDVDPVFRSLRRDIDVLWIIPDSTVITPESFEVLALLAAEARKPFVAYSEPFVQQGALLGFYADPTATAEQCANLVGKVSRGELAIDKVGIRAPERVFIAVNRRVEDQLGRVVAPTLPIDREFR